MTNPPLTLTRFRALAEAYGSNLERWPESEREGAEALVVSSEEARALLRAEEALDHVFASAATPALPPELLARLERVPDAAKNVHPLRLPRRALRAPLIGWAAAALFGLWLGTQSAGAEEVDESTSRAVSEASIDSQVLELANGTLDDWEEVK